MIERTILYSDEGTVILLENDAKIISRMLVGAIHIESDPGKPNITHPIKNNHLGVHGWSHRKHGIVSRAFNVEMTDGVICMRDGQRAGGNPDPSPTSRIQIPGRFLKILKRWTQT